MYENLRRVQKGKKICHISNQHIESNKLNHDSQTAHVTDRFKCILKRGLIPTPECHKHVLPPERRAGTCDRHQRTGTKPHTPYRSARCGPRRSVTPHSAPTPLSLPGRLARAALDWHLLLKSSRFLFLKKTLLLSQTKTER